MSIARAARSFVTILLVIAFAASACVPGRSDEAAGVSADEDPAAAGQTDGQAEVEQLVTAFDRDVVVCDNLEHALGEIRGALPGERILFSSPLPIEVPEITADQSGRFDMRWRCDPSEARLQWELKAVGHDSGRAVTFTITGAVSDPISDGLTVSVTDEPFACDGFTKPIGTLSNAFANEQIVFTSPESSNLRPGRANEFGELELNWECEPAQAGITWNVTATGADSRREGLFVIVGGPVDGSTLPDPIVEMTEDPFVCDGNRRSFATLRNFAPDEVIDFSSPDSEGLIDSRADATGSLAINWQCGLADVGKVWRLTATGVSSQREVTLVITGAPPPDNGETATRVDYFENPFGCDGGSRAFATIYNFVPNELVDFVSPQSGDLRQGQANEQGELAVRWQCGAADIDKIWDITATGATSGRTATLQVTGASPPSE